MPPNKPITLDDIYTEEDIADDTGGRLVLEPGLYDATVVSWKGHFNPNTLSLNYWVYLAVKRDSSLGWGKKNVQIISTWLCFGTARAEFAEDRSTEEMNTLIETGEALMSENRAETYFFPVDFIQAALDIEREQARRLHINETLGAVFAAEIVVTPDGEYNNLGRALAHVSSEKIPLNQIEVPSFVPDVPGMDNAGSSSASPTSTPPPPPPPVT